MEGNGGLHPAVDRQTTVEGIDGGLHSAVDRGQWRALMEGYILQWTEDSGGHWWRATSCSGQATVEGIDGGLHPAVDRQWRALMEGYILQWVDNAL